MTTTDLNRAYDYCLQLARSHYENFPVASIALPRDLRRPIAVIYAFARTADDFADEPTRDAVTRLKLLQAYREQLQQSYQTQTSTDPIFTALGDVITRHELPLNLLDDLLTAFIMDVTTLRYATYSDVMGYCRYSANPIGRLLLHLVNQTDETSLDQSDAVCTALQLINFWQDLAQDYNENQRIYVPQSEWEKFAVTEPHFRNQLTDEGMRGLMQLQYQRTRELLQRGFPLGATLRGRLGFEIRLTLAAGEKILDALDRQTSDVFSRPRLHRRDWLSILWRAARVSQYRIHHTDQYN